MPSTFFGLTIGYSGLLTYQAALNTTGNNIANVDTPGYSRQQVTQRAAKALRTHTKYGMAGSGVDAVSIDQLRNTYYDIKYWNNQADLGEYTMKAYYMKQIENYFNDDGEKIMGFNTIYVNRFYNALEDLEDNPGDTSVRTSFIGAAQSLAEYFNTMSANLTKLQKDTNEEIKDKVDEINSIASQIATLNKQINLIEMKGVTANELRDQRNLLIDRLSAIVNVEVREVPIYNSNDPDNPTGAHRYMVNISGGCSLVDGYDYNELYCASRQVGNKVNQSDAEGLYEIYWKHTDMPFEPSASTLSGELKALIDVRDGNNNEYFHGEVKGFTAETTTQGAKVEIAVTADYLIDPNKATLNNIGTVVVNNVAYEYTGWTYDKNSKSYTFELAMNDQQKVSTDRIASGVGTNASIGGAVDYQGIPYYMAQMNEWVRNFSKVFNDIETSGEDLYGNKLAGDSANNVDPTSFFVATDPTDTQHQYNFAQQDTVSSSSDCYYLMTAATFSVSRVMIADSARMATTAKDGNINIDANDLIQQLELIKTSRDMMVFRGCSSSEFLQCILSDAALNAASANNFETNYSNVGAAIENQRLTVSGVDNDEEALALVKFQNAYNLSAKMIQVMTEVYDRLILQTGV